MTTTRPHPWQQQPDSADLAADSFTAQKLQHATPEHLHLTSRRFFIGSIPEGWLKKNRRDWYKHHLHLNYSSRIPSFSSDRRGSRNRRLSGLEGPSSSALFQHSFPQPDELSEEEEDVTTSGEQQSSDQATTNTPPALEVPRATDQKAGIVSEEEEAEYVDAPSEPDEEHVDGANDSRETVEGPSQPRRASTKSFVTASSSRVRDAQETPDGVQPGHPSDEQVASGIKDTDSKSLGKRPLSSVESANGGLLSPPSADPPVDAVSTTSLLPKTDVAKGEPDLAPSPSSNGILDRARRRSDQPLSGQIENTVTRTKSGLRNLVRFDIPEDSKRAELQLKAKQAQMTIQRASARLRRAKVKDGLVVKMERMLIRVDAAGKEVPDEFDENGNQKIDSRVKEKWREYMVVCRQCVSEDADFVLQMYKTRVIPEIEEKGTSKKAAFEIPLGRKITKVNLYSSLDKSVVVWLPVSRGTQIFIMQARTASNAVEWYTFIRNVLGWRRASELQINIPDLSVSLRLSDPFQKLEASQAEAQEGEITDAEEAVLRTMQEEQAVAENLIKRCLEQLEDAPEWMDVVDSWIKDQRVGLAWKRYDRLEWIHGANERKMYGTIAMQKSHDLELRPKQHYPTTIVTKKKQKTMVEPVPVEGFLIRLTGQRGRAQRMGLMYHKQLYFCTHDHFLVFLRPTKAVPPPPPKLPAGHDAEVPSARSIVEQIPSSWALDPYPLEGNGIRWLTEGHSGTTETRRLHDQDAADEDARKNYNLLNCDGYINLADVIKVRKAQLGATPSDADIDTGSDVDFDEDVDDTAADDGATREVDVQRALELVMRNGLVVRLQAADQDRRKEWVKHLRALAKYWRHRTTADINLYKTTRSTNLNKLNIDEEGEAYIGQFAKKWEVNHSFASPQLYNLCGIACCRSIHMSGTLYRKPRIHAPFTRCSVILAAGTLIIFQDVLRSKTGKQLAHIHHERSSNLDLKDCYIYSGLLTESDLLYQNQTFDANKPGHHALPRIYLEDGWTSTDEDVMTTFVIWHGKSKSWFRAEEGAGEGEQDAKQGTRTTLKRVAALGSKGRSVVFRARSRAERDHWVLAIQNEIERVQDGRAEDFRITDAGGTGNGSS